MLPSGHPSRWCCPVGTHHIGAACLVGIYHIGAAQRASITLVVPSGHPSHWCRPVGPSHRCCPVVGTHLIGTAQWGGNHHIGAAQWAPITLALPSGHSAPWCCSSVGTITLVLFSGQPSHKGSSSCLDSRTLLGSSSIHTRAYAFVLITSKYRNFF